MNDTVATDKPLAAPALPRENFKPIRQCANLGELFSSAEFRERIVASVPRHMTNDRILSVVLRAHTANPLLLQASPMSFAGACLTATNTGLEPNSALQEAHLIPFRMTDRKTKREIVQIQVIFGYSGLLKLVDNTGRVLTRSANVVYDDADIFDWMEGSETFLRFKRGGRRDRKPDDIPTRAYFHAKLLGGGESMEVWPWGDVLRIRNMSQAYRRALNAKNEAEAKNQRLPLTWTEAPWVKWLEAMARKTMIRAGTKYLPKSVELANAVRIDEVQDRRDIDYSRIIDMAGNEPEPDYAGTAATLGEEHAEEDNGAPDAAFGDHRPAFIDQAARTGQRQATETTGAPAASTAPKAPAFEHYLIDTAGEPSPEPYVDPVVFATDFIKLYQHASARERETLAENNEMALEEARHLPIADQMLAVVNPDEEAPGNPPTIPIAQERGGRPDWRKYATDFRAVLFGWRGSLEVWLDAQREHMERAPLASRLLLVRMVRERAEQIRQSMPEWLADLAKPGPDPDERWAEGFIAHLASLREATDVTEYARSGAVQTVMRRLRAEKPSLFERVDAATAERLAELGDDGAPA